MGFEEEWAELESQARTRPDAPTSKHLNRVFPGQDTHSKPDTTDRCGSGLTPRKTPHWVRWAHGCALALLSLVSLYGCSLSFVTQPNGSWDRDTVDEIKLMCAYTMLVAWFTVLYALLPNVRRAVGNWWLVFAILLFLAPAGRMAALSL